MITKIKCDLLIFFFKKKKQSIISKKRAEKKNQDGLRLYCVMLIWGIPKRNIFPLGKRGT